MAAPGSALLSFYDASSGKLKEEYAAEYWSHFMESDHPRLFGYDNVRVAPDGGLSGVPKLLYRKQYTKALTTAALVLVNVGVVLSQDFQILTDPSDNASMDKFLISDWLLYIMFGDRYKDQYRGKLPPLIEIALLVILCLNVIWRFLEASCSSANRQLKRWSAVEYMFWCTVPIMRRFSALQQLYYVTPGILKMEAALVLLHVKQRIGAKFSDRSGTSFLYIWPMLKFILKRAVAFIIGFDAFLVKFRLASKAVNADSMQALSYRDLLNFASFFFQVLGVVDLKRLMRERLFIFVFGGKDGNMDIDEEALAKVWRAIMAKRIYGHFGRCQGTIVMLGFDDFDFQMLALDDDEESIRLTVRSAQSTVRASTRASVPIDFDPSPFEMTDAASS